MVVQFRLENVKMNMTWWMLFHVCTASRGWQQSRMYVLQILCCSFSFLMFLLYFDWIIKIILFGKKSLDLCFFNYYCFIAIIFKSNVLNHSAAWSRIRQPLIQSLSISSWSYLSYNVQNDAQSWYWLFSTALNHRDYWDKFPVLQLYSTVHDPSAYKKSPWV